MRWSGRFICLWIVIGLGFLFWVSHPAQAQDEPLPYNLEVSAPNLEAFPRIDTFVDVYDETGNFVHGLQPDDLLLLEDGAQISPLSLQVIRPGAQIVLVVNPGASFTLQNSQAVSRYDTLSQGLIDWLQSKKGSTIDDWSLLVADAASIQHTNNPVTLIEALEQQQPVSRASEPGLDAAFAALELAGDPTPRPGMGRAMILITSPLGENNAQSLENLSMRAQELNVRIQVWMVGALDTVSRAESERLRILAESTSGTFFAFDGENELPSLESSVDPLREIYQVAYLSQVRGGGAHTFSLQLQKEGVLASDMVEIKFDKNVLPAIPALMQPPTVVERRSRQQPESYPTAGEASAQPDVLAPEQLTLQIVIDYPDGWARPLKRTSLWVDQVLVSENTSPPFETFSWDLTPYTSSGDHLLRFEVEDELGLVGQSVESLVTVNVAGISSNPFSLVPKNLFILGGAVLLILGGLAFLGFVHGGKFRPRLPGKDTALAKEKQLQLAKSAASPKTAASPTPLQAGGQSRPSLSSRLSLPAQLALSARAQKAPANAQKSTRKSERRRHSDLSIAYLAPLEKTAQRLEDGADARPASQARAATPLPGQLRPLAPIPIVASQVTLGSDPAWAIVVLHDPSVENRHARLEYRADKTFWLTDEGSVAGTWVNFSQIPSEGVQIHHGDTLHFGGCGFRFLVRNSE